MTAQLYTREADLSHTRTGHALCPGPGGECEGFPCLGLSLCSGRTRVLEKEKIHREVSEIVLNTYTLFQALESLQYPKRSHCPRGARKLVGEDNRQTGKCLHLGRPMVMSAMAKRKPGQGG